MSTIKNVGELRALIAELPDDMLVVGYDGSDHECSISWWTIPNNLSEIEEKVEDLVLVLSTD